MALYVWLVKSLLFLCTANSARSVLAEAIANRLGGGQVVAYSAGSQPRGQVHPLTLKFLASRGYDTQGFRSKSWDEFAESPRMDVVITVCNNAAGEVCPVWPGQPAKLHWDIADPALNAGDEEAGTLKLFEAAYDDLYLRIQNLVKTLA